MNADSLAIEMDFIREFSVAGNQIGLSSSADDKRERIRLAIYKSNLHDKIYHDSEITYAAMYRLCYGRPLEQRKYPRVEVVAVHADDEDDIDDE